ncbi:hypothetical protein PanWU01x14_057180 [Parasponia andersonii]|uniref:Uncharacterized protein n=1 Tax=Parasponia andersonii TaxID=3476 RepID=A0A2P5DJT1_PARAD|nr:hypothetical protein PanWU01x14_057180 [Parasponia andersonii]
MVKLFLSLVFAILLLPLAGRCHPCTKRQKLRNQGLTNSSKNLLHVEDHVIVLGVDGSSDPMPLSKGFEVRYKCNLIDTKALPLLRPTLEVVEVHWDPRLPYGYSLGRELYVVVLHQEASRGFWRRNRLLKSETEMSRSLAFLQRTKHPMRVLSKLEESCPKVIPLSTRYAQRRGCKGKRSPVTNNL